MNQKTEGTLVLDGLIEGRLPDDPGIEEKLHDWVRLAKRLGLTIDIEIEGGGFSLLADAKTVSTAAMGGDPTFQIRSALAQLVAAFPEAEQAQMFSTLRSIEYAPGREIQTVYAIRPGGAVEAEQRTLEATTTAPPRTMTANERLRTVGVSVVVLAALFGTTSLFVDWGSVVGSLWQKVVPLEVEAVVVDGARFAEFFVVDEKERGTGSTSIHLTLRRTAAYPLDDDAVAAALSASPLPFERRLALEALARGYVRVEVFAKDGTFLGFGEARVSGLRTAETVGVEIPVPRDPRPARLVLGY